MSDHLPLNPTSLIAILRLPYSCLESFSIQMSGRHPKWNWNDFSSELKDAISSFIHLPTLQTLSLDNIDMPITLLQGIHLTTLELSEISPKGLDAKQSSLLTPEGMETTAPQDMVIDQCLWYFFYKPVRGTKFPISAYFSLIWDTERLTEPIFLPFVCRLRVFDITVHLDSPTILMMDSDVLSFLMRSLHLSLTSPAALEHLKFGIIFNGKGNLDDNAFYDDLRGADVWRHLDSIITLPAGSRLQRVDIDIDYEFRCDNDVAELDDTKILEVMLDALPLLREKGILSCSSTFYLNYRSLTRFGGVEVKWSRCQC